MSKDKQEKKLYAVRLNIDGADLVYFTRALSGRDAADDLRERGVIPTDAELEITQVEDNFQAFMQVMGWEDDEEDE